MNRSMNRHALGELFLDEQNNAIGRYGEYLSQLEATHERKVREQQGRNEIEQGVCGVQKVECLGDQVPQA